MKRPYLLLSALLLVPACMDPTLPDAHGEPGTPASLAQTVRITVNPPTAVIVAGGSLQLATVVRDSRGVQLWPVIRWSSSDTLVARVGTDGLVTALRPGQVTITATCAGGTGTVRITVDGPDEPVIQDALRWSFMLAGGGLAPLYDVWGTSASDVFAVGSSMLWDCCGTILHFDGAGWSYMAVPGGLGEVHGIWGSSNRDVFAVGWDGILHYDGVTWSPMPAPKTTLEAVWGNSATDVFAVGYRGVILHYDGTSWTEMASTLGEGEWLADVWGTSSHDVFAVGTAILHYDGVSWSGIGAPHARGLTGVWGSASDDVFAVGHGGTILHYDGAAWKQMSAPARDGDLMDIWGTSGRDIIAVGDRNQWGPEGCCSDVLHYDGTGWRVQRGMTGLALYGVWGTGDHVFIVGAGPTILRGSR